MNTENNIPKPKNNYFSLYAWAIRASYSYMQGSRNMRFWLVLPWKAHKIAWATVHDVCL